MFKKTIFAGLMLAALVAAPATARAVANPTDPDQSHYSDAAYSTAEPSPADAAALAAIEPAAGGDNIFTATLKAQKKTSKHSQDPDPAATAAEKTRRVNGADVQ